MLLSPLHILSMVRRFFQWCWRSYQGCLKEHPYKTTSLTSGSLFLLGDLLGQTIHIQHDHEDGYDPKRTLRLLAFGLTMSGPVAHKWHLILARFIPKTSPHHSLKRLATHSLVYSPIHLSVFNGWMAVSEEEKQHPWERIKERTPMMWIHGSFYWLPIAYLTFQYVSLHNRVLVTNVANIGWTTYLSLTGTGSEVRLPVATSFVIPEGITSSRQITVVETDNEEISDTTFTLSDTKENEPFSLSPSSSSSSQRVSGAVGTDIPPCAALEPPQKRGGDDSH